jgi:CDP-glucose 4,6-dehydratase
MFDEFFKGKRVFLTGHTGFKGTWLSLWLTHLGATVHGYSDAIPTKPSLFEQAGLAKQVESYFADVRDLKKLSDAIEKAKPDLIFHFAAQSLVRPSYDNPVDSF